MREIKKYLVALLISLDSEMGTLDGGSGVGTTAGSPRSSIMRDRIGVCRAVVRRFVNAMQEEEPGGRTGIGGSLSRRVSTCACFTRTAG